MFVAIAIVSSTPGCRSSARQSGLCLKLTIHTKDALKITAGIRRQVRSQRHTQEPPSELRSQDMERKRPPMMGGNAYCRQDATDLADPADKAKWREVMNLVCARKPSFPEAYKFFANSNRFFQLGPLGAYLLTADYSYAGFISPPTLAELAKIICDLDKGAVAGLELLGLIPMRERGPANVKTKPDGKRKTTTAKPKKAKYEDVLQGLTIFFRIVEEYFGPESAVPITCYAGFATLNQ
ncbi:hypothetical protein C8J57DRAFT_1634584 [Mycena rebaudengoi]|nr:hypothetical protein C8J57DRAFT_1634584 [Mycena rebaudengoi]